MKMKPPSDPKKTNPNKPKCKRGTYSLTGCRKSDVRLSVLYSLPSVLCLLFSVFCFLSSVFCSRRLLIDPMLPLYKLSNVQYYSRYNFKVKFSKISIISILTQAKLTKYRWKIMPAAAIFNPIKKLTITRTGAKLKGRRVI